MDKAIIIKDLSKKYFLNASGKSGFFRNLGSKKDDSQAFYALKDINIEINKGELIGIIGPNGAGKSTLLKIIAEVTPPSSGSIELFGKVASILEIGIGFQPDLTGYENIFLSGELYGLSKKEINKKLDEIIDMFGFPDFLNSAVKYYSSGMYMRLAFSIIIHMEADIYLFDEILSVGDTRFQEKALAEIDNLKESGATICVVTHAPKTIYHLCDSMLLISKGAVYFYGNPNDTIIEYRTLISQHDHHFNREGLNHINNTELDRIKHCDINLKNANFDLMDFAVYNTDLSDLKVFTDQDINILIKYKYYSQEDFQLILVIQDDFGTALVSHFIDVDSSEALTEASQKFVIKANTFNEIKVTFDILVSTRNQKIIISYRNLIDIILYNENKISKLMGYINIPIELKS